MQRKDEIMKPTQFLACLLAVVLCAGLGCRTSVSRKQRPSLEESADVVIIAQVLSVDAARTIWDGPVVTKAKVLRVLKGNVSEGQIIEFEQSAWGHWDDFKAPGARRLFLKRSPKPTPPVYNGWCEFYLLGAAPEGG